MLGPIEYQGSTRLPWASFRMPPNEALRIRTTISNADGHGDDELLHLTRRPSPRCILGSDASKRWFATAKEEARRPLEAVQSAPQSSGILPSMTCETDSCASPSTRDGQVRCRLRQFPLPCSFLKPDLMTRWRREVYSREAANAPICILPQRDQRSVPAQAPAARRR